MGTVKDYLHKMPPLNFIRVGQQQRYVCCVLLLKPDGYCWMKPASALDPFYSQVEETLLQLREKIIRLS